MTDVLRIASNFVVMSNDFDAEIVAVTDRLYAELNERYGDFKGRTLICCHHTAKVREPAEMLFPTPGEGTENRQAPGRE